LSAGHALIGIGQKNDTEPVLLPSKRQAPFCSRTLAACTLSNGAHADAGIVRCQRSRGFNASAELAFSMETRRAAAVAILTCRNVAVLL
jgi:hypothetical protein